MLADFPCLVLRDFEILTLPTCCKSYKVAAQEMDHPETVPDRRLSEERLMTSPPLDLYLPAESCYVSA